MCLCIVYIAIAKRHTMVMVSMLTNWQSVGSESVPQNLEFQIFPIAVRKIISMANWRKYVNGILQSLDVWNVMLCRVHIKKLTIFTGEKNEYLQLLCRIDFHIVNKCHNACNVICSKKKNKLALYLYISVTEIHMHIYQNPSKWMSLSFLLNKFLMRS